MKKIIFALLIAFASTTLFSQEKGLYLTVGGSVGRTNFKYGELGGVTPKAGIGFGAGLGVQYFFTKHLGLSLGLEYALFNTSSYIKDKRFDFPGFVDNEGDDCDLVIRLLNWTESQKTHFIDIPLMLRFQHKWGKKEMHGFYFAFGPKLQIPISASSFKIADGDLKAYAYYPDYNLPIADGYGVELPQHGYGTTQKDWNGKNELKTGCAIVGEAGFLIGLSRRIDLTLGVSAEYGFSNIQKKSIDLMEAVKNITPQDVPVGDVVTYNGILNSNRINVIHPVALKAHLGLRIKIGKLSEKKEEDDQDKKLDAILEKLSQPRDTIIINPVVVPVYLPAPTPNDEGGAVVGGVVAAGKKAPITQEIIDDIEEPIYFDLDKYNLDAEAIAILDRKVDQMKRYPQLTVSLVGHTCDLGNNPHNDELSLNRAQAARMYMIGKGIKPTRLEVIPMGKIYPSYPNTSESSRRMNRRVDFVNSTK